MGVRRERPPVERSQNSIRLRLPDGRVKEMPVDGGPDSAASDVCCFCGRRVDDSGGGGGGPIRLSARWMDDGQEHAQSWRAHRRCLAERLHDAVAGAGPFFGG